MYMRVLDSEFALRRRIREIDFREQMWCQIITKTKSQVIFIENISIHLYKYWNENEINAIKRNEKNENNARPTQTSKWSDFHIFSFF